MKIEMTINSFLAKYGDLYIKVRDNIDAVSQYSMQKKADELYAGEMTGILHKRPMTAEERLRKYKRSSHDDFSEQVERAMLKNDLDHFLRLYNRLIALGDVKVANGIYSSKSSGNLKMFLDDDDIKSIRVAMREFK